MVSKDYTVERRLLVICAIVPAIVVAALGFLSRQTEKDLDQSVQWVSHTFEVIAHLRALSRELADAQTSQRGFLITTNTVYLQNYETSVSRTHANLNLVGKLTSDNATQQTNLQKLSPLITERLAQLDLAIKHAREDRMNEAIAFVKGGAGKVTADEIASRLALMEEFETQLLTNRQQNLSARFAAHSRINYVLLILTVLLGAAILYLLSRVAKSQALLTICAWSKTIHYEGQWLTFEQYMLRRFDVKITHGMSPDAAEKMLQEADSIGEDTKYPP